MGTLQPGMEKHSDSAGDIQYLFLFRITTYVITLKCDIGIESKSPFKMSFDVGDTVFIRLL